MGTPMTTTDLLEPLPDLNTGPRRTTTSAIRRVKYVGSLAPWAPFKQETMQTFENTAWAPNPLAIRLPNTPLLGDLAQEHVRCGSVMSSKLMPAQWMINGVLFSVKIKISPRQAVSRISARLHYTNSRILSRTNMASKSSILKASTFTVLSTVRSPVHRRPISLSRENGKTLRSRSPDISSLIYLPPSYSRLGLRGCAWSLRMDL
jgi:hypothetical protein